MTRENFIKAQLLRFAIETAMHGGVPAVVGVAEVLRNRVEAGWNNGEWMEVLDDAPTKLGNQVPRPIVDWRGDQFRSLLYAVDGIYHRIQDPMFPGALHVADLTLPVTPWFQANILDRMDSHPRIGNVGSFYFFG